MDIKNQLEESITAQKAIIIDCYLIIKDIKFLSTDNHAQEIADVIAGDRFFLRTGEYMWTIIVLELNKLYDKKENYALSKTLNIVINNARILNVKQKSEIDNIVKLREKIESKEIGEIIKKLNYIRDKKVAHLDRNRMDKEVLVHLNEVKELVDLGQETLSIVNASVNGHHLGLDVEFLGLAETTVTKLANQNKESLMKYGC